MRIEFYIYIESVSRKRLTHVKSGHELGLLHIYISTLE